MEEEEEEALRDPFLEQTLKIPQDFISEMKEAFRYFDKVRNQFSETTFLLRVAVAFSVRRRCRPC